MNFYIISPPSSNADDTFVQSKSICGIFEIEFMLLNYLPIECKNKIKKFVCEKHKILMKKFFYYFNDAQYL